MSEIINNNDTETGAGGPSVPTPVPSTNKSSLVNKILFGVVALVVVVMAYFICKGPDADTPKTDTTVQSTNK